MIEFVHPVTAIDFMKETDYLSTTIESSMSIKPIEVNKRQIFASVLRRHEAILEDSLFDPFRLNPDEKEFLQIVDTF